MAQLRLQPQEISAGDSWRLVSWLLETGSNEFTISCLGGSAREAGFCKAAADALSRFAMEPQPRPRSTRSLREPPNLKRPLWRLDEASIAVLRTLMPAGIFTDSQGATDGWIEDLTVYDEAGQIRLGVITHEGHAILNVSQAERLQLRDLRLLT
jgi:hypothetical protein